MSGWRKQAISATVVASLLVACGHGSDPPVERAREQRAALTTQGLVAAFGFDEGSGTSTQDAGPSGPTVPVDGPSWVVGKYGSALDFEDSYLTLPQSPRFDLTTAMTLAAWVLPRTAEPGEMIVLAKQFEWDTSYWLKGGSTWHGAELTLLGETSGTARSDRLPITKWSHLAGTYDGAMVRLYVDGRLTNETPFEGGASVTQTPLRIGGTWWGDYFSGRIDEVRVYDRPLSASEIADVMAEPVTPGASKDVVAPAVALTSPAAGAVSGRLQLTAEASDAGGVASVEFLVDGVPCDYPSLSWPYQAAWHASSATPGSHQLRARATDFEGNTSLSVPVTVTVAANDTTPGLIAAFGFDEGSGDDLHDASGAGHDSVRSGQSWVVGKYGAGLEFSEAYVQVESTHLLDFTNTNTMTVSAWVLPKAGVEVGGTLIAKEETWESSFELYAGGPHDGPEWHVFGEEHGQLLVSKRLPVTRWSHVAASYDGASLKLYVDGVLANETPYDGGMRIARTPLRIGGMTWDRFFRGRIDEVRVHDRALSPAEIVGIMSQPVTAGAATDTTAPTVSLVAPAEGNVTGQVGLAADASDLGGIATVEFLVDGTPYGPAAILPPYQGRWHSGAATPGVHELRARATDVAGNVALSAPVVVSVDAAETTPGLVAAYSFDEGSGDDVHDVTGAGHDAVRSSQSWVVGKFGSALDFRDDPLEVPGSHLLDLKTPKTVAVWILPDDGDFDHRAVVVNGDYWVNQYLLYSSGSWHGGPDWAVLGSTSQSASNATWLPRAKWTHLAGTYDGASAKLYVDGALVAETEVEGFGDVVGTPLLIGGSPWGDTFHGRIDELRIYNRALSGTELVGIMSQPVTPGTTGDVTSPLVVLTQPSEGPVMGRVELAAEASDQGGVATVEFLVDGQPYGPRIGVAPYRAAWHSSSATAGSHELRARATDYAGNVSVSDPVLVTIDAANTVPGLVAAYGFDEGSGDYLSDATGAGHDSERTDQIWVAGKYGSALEFDSDWLDVETTHLLNLTSSLTLSAWVLPEPGEHGFAPVIAKEGVWAGAYVLSADGDHHGPELALRGPDWGTVSTGRRLPTTKWSHLAATYEAQLAKLYIDGELVAEGEIEGPINVIDEPLRIGGALPSQRYFRGRIDEVRIYNRALSASELTDVMARPVTLGASADLIGPTVSLVTPASGPVTGMVELTAAASDASGVAQVEFLADGVTLGAARYSPPYQTRWHARSATPGSHELRVRATDYAGNVSVSEPVVVTVDAANTVPGLVAAFAFDEGSGEDVHDSTGAGHDAVRSGQSWVGGRFGSALEFNDAFLEIEGSYLLDLTTAMTVSLWALPNEGDSANTTLVGKEYEWETSFLLRAGAWHGGPEWSLLGTDWGTAGTSERLRSTKWSHVAGTYDGAHVRLYVDGALAAESEFEGGARVSDTPLRIGGATWGNFFRGRIDEVRIYNRALSGPEIVGVMSQPVIPGATADVTGPTVSLTAPANGPVSGVVTLAAQASDAGGVRTVEFLVDGQRLGGPVAAPPYEKQWHAASATPGTHELRARAVDFFGNASLSAPVVVSVQQTGAVPGLVAAFGFDEAEGNDVHDATGAGHDTVLAGQTRTAGRYGSALAFDGSFLTVADSDLLDLTTAMTLSAWVQPQQPLPSWPTVVMKEGPGGLAYALYAGSGGTGAPSVWYRPEADDVGGEGGAPLELGLWTHLAATFDGNELRLYVNGEPTFELATSESIPTTTGPVRIGGNAIWNTEWFYGLIDEVRIYDRALSQSEIESDMVRPVAAGAAEDTTPPTVAITEPSSASVVYGNVALRAQASDAYGIESVQFFVDGVAVGDPLTTAPFQTTWDALTATAGSHSITALAFDGSGNSSLSAPVLVTVSNDPPACDAATVSDGNPCTADSCNAAGQPVFTPLAAGTSCSDGDRCNGTELCSGSGICAPGTPPSTDATCDGVDDDCDGEVDENFASASTSCGVGACARSGARVCQAGSVVDTCSPGVAAANDTTCNGVDDDCNGQNDEDYVAAATSCGVGVCAATGITSCVSGAVQNSCSPGSPALSDSDCDGVDDDCDGSIDEGYVSVVTSCGSSSCAATGTTSCSNGSVVDSCTPATPAASDANCDGIDNDCDGAIDEGFVPTATTCGVGACAATGTTSCVNGVLGNSCTSGVAAANDASCDGVDDDCNGQNDEDFSPATTNCGQGACAAIGTTSCVNGAVQNSCTPGTPASSDASCDGIDDDCDGVADGGYVAPVTHCGVGACAANGHQLCVAGQLQNDCQAGTASASDATCNGADDDCDGSADEDYVATAVSCGTGACQRSGNLRCQAGSVVNDCAAGTPAASDASCNGIDDDCDGSTDENYVSIPTTCSSGACQAFGQTSCVAGDEEDSCQPTTSSGSDETCDGVDNDCDGTPDDGYQPHSTNCGVGACARTGTTSCSLGTESNSCVPGPAASSDATCNGIDDDCDGSVDEEYAVTATTCGVGACAAPGTLRCQAGSTVLDCKPGSAAASDTTCNGVDDDCDGTVDEDYVPAPTSCGVGACAAAGTSRCEGGVVVSGCTQGSPAGADSTCDGIDNDCDGSTDEGYLPEPISCGVGVCVRQGETRCVAGTVEPVCTAGTPTLNDTSCNGLDDDCDGAVDEAYVPQPTTCGQGSCSANGTTACQNGQIVDSCQPSAAATNDSVCNGIDDDCDGGVDEDFVPQGATCGIGACSAVGVTQCSNGQLGTTCAPGTPAATDATCDGVDDDCDGSVDENFAPQATVCGLGACHATGATSCASGHVTNSCTPGTPASSDASCNGSDDDCDGAVDEEFVSANTTCGVGTCASTGSTSCSGGVVSNSCVAGTAALVDDDCNGRDDNCNGSVDEQYLGHATACGQGACAATGSTSCVDGHETNSCHAGTPAASDTSCDGVDDDCDGSTDEEFQTSTTECGIGACKAQGLKTCSGGHVTDSCAPRAAAPTDSSCDGVDDDCDGTADEAFVGSPTTCGVGACRNNGVSVCLDGVVSPSCTPLPAASSDGSCDGIDDDCDGVPDEDFEVRCQGSAVQRCTQGATQLVDCVDSNVCNGVESCSQAICRPGTAPSLDDQDPCTTDRCEPSGGITHAPAPRGTACGAGKACNDSGQCLGLPVINQQPQSATADPGQPMSLVVSASGADLSYQWRRFGQDIPGASSAAYVLENVALSDDGAEFTVLVSNGVGSVTSTAAVLRVRDTGGPILTVDGAAARTVTTDFVTITGNARDPGSSVASVTVTSNRFSSAFSALLSAVTGVFSVEVPLKVGDNLLKVDARDAQGNLTQRSLIVRLGTDFLPRVQITEPAPNAVVTANTVDVRGTVRSSFAASAIRMRLGDEVRFPEGSNHEYTFEFSGVHLVPGNNTLTVRAETTAGASTSQVVVRYGEPSQPDPGIDPKIRLNGTQAEFFTAASEHLVSGTVTATRCVSQVTVNGASADIKGSGSEISFDYKLLLPPGDARLNVEVRAVDCDGRSASLPFSVLHDDVKPVFNVSLPAGSEHVFAQTPATISGTITEKYLAGLTSTQQSVGVLPGANGTWDFTLDVPLIASTPQNVTLEAWDHAGNRETYQLRLRLDAAVDIQVLSPTADGELVSADSPTRVDAVARVAGLAADQSVMVALDLAPGVLMTRSGSTFSSAVDVSGATGKHSLTFTATRADGSALSQKRVPFSIKAASDVPLAGSIDEPLNGSQRVEVDQVVLITFNRPVSLAQLSVESRETVHGKQYKPAAPGSGFAEFTNIELMDVNRDGELVPGGLSLLPGGLSVVFYPSRQFAYGAAVTTVVKHAGVEVARGRFDVRPLPTLVNGYVIDESYGPLEGVSVTLPDIGVSTRSNADGSFSFGYGSVANAIAGGRHRMVVNAGRENANRGSDIRYVYAQEGRLVDAGYVISRRIDPNEPFRLVRTGGRSAFLNNAVDLDFANAELLFPNGQHEGTVQAQVVFGPSLGYPRLRYITSIFSLAFQPMGVEVAGSVALDMALPEDPDGHDYVSGLPERVLLAGVDAESLQLVPVGVGHVDSVTRRVRSEGALRLKRLDFVSFVPLRSDAEQALLAAYAANQLGLEQLISQLGAMQ